MLSIGEQKLLQEICHNSKTALMDIHTMLGKIYDDELALDLNRQATGYSRMEEKARNRLLSGGVIPEPVGIMDRTKRWAAWQAQTALNVSTEHVAQIMLREEKNRHEQLRASVSEQKETSDVTAEMAEELLSFEDESMRILQTYL